MSNVVITLATNRIQIFRDATPDELLNSVTYINVTSVNPLVQVKKRLDGSTPGMSDPTTHPTVTTEDTDWIVELHMADGRIEHINLAEVVTPAGWTNDQTGYEQAEEDIYAAFPTASGGSGITGITGTDGYTYAGTPTSTMSGSALRATGNTLFVDAVNGNDGTGTRGQAGRPYLTIAAAIADALDLDLIVVRPGVYAAGIADTGSSATVLFFYISPGAYLGACALSQATTAWNFYGHDLEGSTSFTISGGAIARFYAGCATTLSVSGAATVFVYGSFVSLVLTECEVTLYGCARGGTIFTTQDTVLTMHDSVAAGITNVGTAVAIDAYNSTGGILTGSFAITGDLFDGSTNTPGSVATVNADGSWGWAAGGGGGNTILELDDTDSVNIDGSVDQYIMVSGGTADVVDPGGLPVGTKITIATGAGCSVTFTPDTSVDGAGSATLGASTYGTFTQYSAGNWITTG